MSKGKAATWLKDNIVFLVGIPLIIGVHYGWAKLQDVPYLVDQSKKKEIPLLAAFNSIKNKLSRKLGLTESTNIEPQEK